MIGGFKNRVTDIDFKYTTDPSRIFWVKTFYPHLGRLASAIQYIEYDSYEYKGDVIFEIAKLRDGDENPYDYVYETLHSVPIHSLDYYFFGGICYELLNDSNKNPSLSNYVDPTGDIDIIINIPDIIAPMNAINNWSKTDNYYGYNANALFFNGVLNPHYLHIAKWVHSELLSIVETLNINIQDSIEFDISEYLIKNKLEMIDAVVGNAHVILYIEGDYAIKVQLIYKIRNSEGLSVIDHVVEFLVAPKDRQYDQDDPDYQYHQTIMVKDNPVNIQEMMSLFRDNFEAHQKRVSFIRYADISKYHKPINHTCRILYLLEYIKENSLEAEWLHLFNVYIIENFVNHRSYNEFHESLIYYKINRGVFELVYIKLSELMAAYCDVFLNNNVTDVCESYDENQYNRIQQLVLHNVREKSIPASLKTSIMSRRKNAEGKRGKPKKNRKTKKRVQQKRRY